MTITASGSTITRSGQGPPVILLHGFGASAYSWRFLGPALAKNHRVFIIDLKGYGLSAKPEDGKYAVRDQADMVAAFIRAGDLHDLVMIGHSMGGGVTLMAYLQVAGDTPARIKKLVLIDSAGYPQKMPLFIWLAKVPGLGSVGGQLLPPRFVTGMALRKCYYHKDRITDEQIDTYAYYGSLPGAREAIVATAQQTRPGRYPGGHRPISQHQRAGPDYLGGGGRGGAPVGRPEFQAGYPQLGTGGPARMRPYPAGRGTPGDQPNRRGFFNKMIFKDKVTIYATFMG